ncbi:AbrB/MazE/SpoVT family DNA-binding domain-containing protein [Acidisoma cladoniae]|uniref:AbrB/MazE/SpoVT family DNA-binding domain-containing protein n=1 Tax=Acidisoma cladoniae TaxID=3040935 RepID=UPI00331413FC
MHVRKSAGGLAVDLPVSVVERLGLKEGDAVEIEVGDDQTLRVSLQDERGLAIAELRARATPLPPDYRFNRDEANER